MPHLVEITAKLESFRDAARSNLLTQSSSQAIMIEAYKNWEGTELSSKHQLRMRRKASQSKKDDEHEHVACKVYVHSKSKKNNCEHGMMRKEKSRGKKGIAQRGEKHSTIVKQSFRREGKASREKSSREEGRIKMLWNGKVKSLVRNLRSLVGMQRESGRGGKRGTRSC